jgi:hypothetical protein
VLEVLEVLEVSSLPPRGRSIELLGTVEAPEIRRATARSETATSV